LSKWAKKVGENKLHNKKGSENDKKQHSAVRRREGRNNNDKLKNGGGKPSNSARPRDGGTKNENAPLTSSRRMCGGAFSKSRPTPALTKYAVRIIAR
jgi:hypothetical protein